MSVENATFEKPSIKISKKEESKNQKNIFLRDIEMSSVKEILLKEIDISKLKESLLDDLKATLLKEIDISGIKEALVKEITIKDLVGSKGDSEGVTTINYSDKSNGSQSVKKEINLPGYKYGLVDSFVQDHKEILSVYETILSSAKDKDYSTLPLMLSQFSKKCLTHFSDEEELYTFMRALAGSRSEIERRIANEFSAEMKNLSLELFAILNQSKFIPVTDNTVAGFLEEFCQLGEILQERISREESVLYPMYENSRKVVDIC